MGMMGSGKSSGPTRAVDAANSAIASPLLEDVNLSGAKGFLVNVTGSNMTLGEFQDIGEIINSFASADATVVMGTAIDEMLNEDIRVTVVATGLCNEKVSKQPFIKPVPTKADGVVDYDEMAKPITKRSSPVEGEFDEDMLDIPSFLRRQAD